MVVSVESNQVSRRAGWVGGKAGGCRGVKQGMMARWRFDTVLFFIFIFGFTLIFIAMYSSVPRDMPGHVAADFLSE
ncbi:hypothetical protein N9995_00390 [bacterium]|nr:hypothetical protein [bacterium]